MSLQPFMQASIESTGTSQTRTHGWLADQGFLTAGAVILLVLLCLPVFTARRSPLNSDQSLYLAEALNIAEGKGATYPTGEPVTHRAPLYPALLAGAFKLQGVSLDSAYLVPRLSIVANVLLLFFLGRTMFGAWGGVVAGVSAGASLYLRGLGTTVFLDSTQVSFLLAALLVYVRAGASPPAMAAAGALLGASFLIKEASALFLPLPLIVCLAYGFEDGWKRTLPAWFAGFTLATAWWFVWVFVHTGDLFLIGSPAGHLGLLLGAASLMGACCLLVLLKFAPRRFAANRLTLLAAGTILLGWNALFFAGLESTGWQYDSNYLPNLVSYMTQIFLPNVQPAPIVLAAWVWLFWSAVRSRTAGVAAAAALLYASFFVLVADRGLSLRDQLPVVYFSFLALGGAAAWLVQAGATFDLGPRVRSLGGAGVIAAVVTMGATVLMSGTSLWQAKATVLQDDWDNPLSQHTAAWLQQNVEAGSNIMSSRLYYSHLYFLTGAAYPIHQLPTVEVDLHVSAGTTTPLTRASTLFRWESHVMPADVQGEPWLYLTRYPQKGYFIGLAENDLLGDLRDRQIDYVVISTLDAGFSSSSFNRYFEDNPAFRLVHVITATPQDEARIYRVDLSQLRPQNKPAQITASAYEYVIHRLAGEEKAAEYLERVNPAGFRLTER
jgi:4-amino-4-deoxy-L-arabinose transferase-like glycosyltransferase